MIFYVMVQGLAVLAKQKYAVSLMILFLVPGLYGFDLTFSGYELGLQYQPEYNRIFYYCWNLSAFGSLELNKRFVIKAGVSMGQIESLLDVHTFVSTEVALPLPIRLPLFVKLAYITNAIPDYKIGIQSLLPTLSIRGTWAGISAGPASRFTSFADDLTIFEPIIAFSGFVTVFYTRSLRIGITIANYDDFVTGNMGSYSLSLNTKIWITNTVSLINEFEVSQTGSVGLAANIYGITYRGGLVLHW